MTRLFNNPVSFADELTAGFVAANRRWVRAVTGGVVRRDRVAAGHVALVVGGGSGHYPAFGGLVGPGLAAGAAMGNLFASPSSQQVYSVARSAADSGGVLLCYGNYAGDVLNFDQAEQRLKGEGIDCRTVVVTDDISSASVAEKNKRRGIAGGLVVYKVAGAAAEAGLGLDDVERIARHANDRTRSFGVAFSGCTLPGSATPLFDVPSGRMAVGMGIHGEPGIDEAEVPSADELAALFVSTLLAELPAGVDNASDQRVALILNGLGSVKYEELFVVYRRVEQLLDAAGVTVVDPEVGELVTSFDMAGVSLTLAWLDEELEEYWLAGADSPAYRKGGVAAGAPDWSTRSAVVGMDGGNIEEIPAATDVSREVARLITTALRAVTQTIDENAGVLGQMDAVAGDGDHGIGMQRGATAARSAGEAAAERGAGAATVLTSAGDAWADRAGGTSGALWGRALRTLGEQFGDEQEVTGQGVAQAMRAASDCIRSFGHAEIGDKTMVDAIVPFVDSLEEAVGAGTPLAEAWLLASQAATEAAAATRALVPRIGRARPHAQKSVGTPDPGAHSFALIVTAVSGVIAGRHNTEK
ncbi:dihydroxyacetone kinase family protein [Cryobacterium sp. Hh7]|uniref:dihydroxyacetone kinase family protein n=1 Tax=Cryobacterium sp. Hh7 TaxID=1259159 RepID=UPI00106DB7DF|nr:dihydroxyacetone kinase family protein [Cryobacterium sp. Hh7]TFD56946.1 dihydroxyacetone kinase family protein [Cryobacterium sp. Hh7]